MELRHREVQKQLDTNDVQLRQLKGKRKKRQDREACGGLELDTQDLIIIWGTI